MSMQATGEQIKRPTPTIVELFLIAALLFMFFRFLAVGFLLVALALHWHYPRHRKGHLLAIAYVLFFLSLLSPVDIDIAGFRGYYHCDRKTGPRLVRLVKGMVNSAGCTEKYGEFIDGGCVGTGFEPRWILVW